MMQVKDGKIVQTELPKVGVLSDGRSVSGYNALPKEVLQAEGWLDVEDKPPMYDSKTQVLVKESEEIQEDKIVIKYKTEAIPKEVVVEPEPSEIDLLKAKVEALEQASAITKG